MYKRSHLIKILILSLILILSTSTFMLTKSKTNANLISNYSFESSDLSLWNSPFGTHSREQYNAAAGSWSLKMVSVYISELQEHVSELVSDPITITAGQEYDLGVYLKSDDTEYIKVELEWSNGVKNTLVTTTVSDWWFFTDSFNAPGGTTSVRIRFINAYSISSQFTFHIDDIIFDGIVINEFDPIVMVPILSISLAILITIKQVK